MQQTKQMAEKIEQTAKSIVVNAATCLVAFSCNFSESANDIDVTDPESVEGAAASDVEKAAEAKGWTGSDAATGPDKGKKYLDASKNNGIRVMQGGGTRTGPDAAVKSGGPYAVIAGGRNAGKVVPLAGNKVLGR